MLKKKGLARTDHDGPDGDKSEQSQVGDLLQREQNGEYMVGDTLRPSVNGVERIAGVRRGNDPFVMGLVKPLVDERIVQRTMNPVDAKVRKRDKQRILDPIVEGERSFAGEIVEFRPSLSFGHKKRRCQSRHDRHGMQRLFDLQRNLIAQELGMLHGTVVIDEIIGNGSTEEV